LWGTLKQKFKKLKPPHNWRTEEKIQKEVCTISQQVLLRKFWTFYSDTRNACRTESISNICFNVSRFYVKCLVCRFISSSSRLCVSKLDLMGSVFKIFTNEIQWFVAVF
jgi:hypothetical protein